MSNRYVDPRIVNPVALSICVGLIAYALYAQHVLGIEPCPLCIFQRVGIVTLGAVFLVAAFHRPRKWGGRVYAALVCITSIATVAVSARHLYIQRLPAGSLPPCGAPLSVLLELRPLPEVLRSVLEGSGECHEVNWQWLGLSMPAWVLIFAVLLGALGVGGNLRARDEKR